MTGAKLTWYVPRGAWCFSEKANEQKHSHRSRILLRENPQLGFRLRFVPMESSLCPQALIPTRTVRTVTAVPGLTPRVQSEGAGRLGGERGLGVHSDSVLISRCLGGTSCNLGLNFPIQDDRPHLLRSNIKTRDICFRCRAPVCHLTNVS